jgi:hypothetical protein
MRKISPIERLRIKVRNMEVLLSSRSMSYRQFNRVARYHFDLSCLLDQLQQRHGAEGE